MNEYKYTPIKMTPFKWFVLENFPFIEEDFDSLTSYGLWCKLKEYFDKVANKTNEMGTQVESLTNAFIQLKDYVDNYFKNLDVQEEINNKLDDMAQDGTLQEIINAYLQSNCIWGFNTINDMLQATNLINGSKCRTLGYYEKNDGGSGLYLIRNRTFEDVIDNGKIHIVNENLVAELIIENDVVNVKQFGAKGDGEIDDYNPIKNCLNVFNNIYFPSGNYNISDNLDVENKKIYGDIETVIQTISQNTIREHQIKFSGNNIISNITFKQKNNNVSLVGFFNCNNSIFENCKFIVDNVKTNGYLDLYSNNQRINFNNCYFEINATDIGGVWIREYSSNHISEHIHFNNCTFNQINSSDEICAVWNWNGIVKNVEFNECTFNSNHSANCPHFIRLDGEENIIINNCNINITSENAGTSSIFKTKNGKIPKIYNTRVLTSNKCLNGVFFSNFEVYNTSIISKSTDTKLFKISSNDDMSQFKNCYFEGYGLNFNNAILYNSVLNCKNRNLRLEGKNIELYNCNVYDILSHEGIINQIVTDNMNNFIIDNSNFYLSSEDEKTIRYFIFHSTSKNIKKFIIKNSLILGGLYQITTENGIVANNITNKVDFSHYIFDNVIFNNNLYIP